MFRRGRAASLPEILSHTCLDINIRGSFERIDRSRSDDWKKRPHYRGRLIEFWLSAGLFGIGKKSRPVSEDLVRGGIIDRTLLSEDCDCTRGVRIICRIPTSRPIRPDGQIRDPNAGLTDIKPEIRDSLYFLSSILFETESDLIRSRQLFNFYA